MKILIPIMTLFLASCGVHNHRYDTDQDAYYEDDYYAYDNYDPYYGYGSSEYSTTGDGVYYNNYNYYPDRWGVTYSNINYSPFRYPRVGFYYSTGHNCGYSYWSNRCSPGWGSGFYGGGFYASNWWPSYGFGLSYSSSYYDNYFWYNHWRNRNYYHNRPSQRGYYSARNEAGRLINGRYYSNYKNNQPRRNNGLRNNQRYGTNNRSNPRAVNRGRSSGNRAINRSSGNRATNRPNQRSRQQSAVQNSRNSNYRQTTGGQISARDQVTGRTNTQSNSRDNLRDGAPDYNQRNSVSNRYQKPALVVSDVNRQRVRNTNTTWRNARAANKPRQSVPVQVKPMNSQSPVYHSNTRPSTVQQNANQHQLNRASVQRPQVQRSNSQAPIRRTNNNAVVRTRPPQSNQQPARTSKPKPQRAERQKSNSKSNNKGSSRERSSRTDKRDRQR